MKSLNFLRYIFFLFVFQGITGQDVNSRMEEFLNQTLPEFSIWLMENHYIPIKLNGGYKIDIKSSSLSEFKENEIQLEGNMWNREYFTTYENTLTAKAIKANLSNYSFTIELTFGGNNSFISGEYNLTGNGKLPIYGAGNFFRNELVEEPRWEYSCLLGVVEDFEYFILRTCSGNVFPPKFEDLVLEALEEEEITSLVNSWYDLQFVDDPYIDYLWFIYLMEVINENTIVDIIGETLPPTMTKSEGSKLEKPFVQSRKANFDKRSKQRGYLSSIGF